MTPEQGAEAGAGGQGDAGAPGDAGAAGQGDAGAGGLNLGGQGGGAPVEGEVFGHSQGQLYKLDPATLAVTKVGSFDCIDGSDMWDIALDKDGVMYGTSGGFSGSLVKIDRATAKCVKIKDGSFPNSLAFIPAGILDASNEVLVGFNGENYVRIDTQSGQVSGLGSLNPNATGISWESSGDVVSIIGDKTYLTAHPVFSGDADSVIEVDPKTGKALKVIGQTGYSKLWGLGYWGGVAYGFSAGGQLLQISLQDGKATALKGLPPGLSFWGAGVTTAAPTGPIN